MPINTSCPACGEQREVSDFHTRVRCTGCGGLYDLVPIDEAAQEEQQEPVYVQCPECLQGHEVPKGTENVTCKICGKQFTP